MPQCDSSETCTRAVWPAFARRLGRRYLRDLRPRGNYWKTIEEDFHWHIEILPQTFRATGFEWASGFFYNRLPPEVAEVAFRQRTTLNAFILVLTLPPAGFG
jgi:hypothetical protein